MSGEIRPMQQVTREAMDRRSERRDEAERLLELAQYLPRDQRLLVEQVYRHGRPVTELARLSGQPPRQLRRQVKTLVRRMAGEEFRFLVGHGDLLPRGVRAVARRVVFQGRSLRDTADATGQSLHRVRQAMQQVRWLMNRV